MEFGHGAPVPLVIWQVAARGGDGALEDVYEALLVDITH